MADPTALLDRLGEVAKAGRNETLLVLVEVARALSDLCDGMGVEFDDERLSYISVQVARQDVSDARAALSRLAALEEVD